MELETLPQSLEGFFDSVIPALGQLILLTVFVSFMIGTKYIQQIAECISIYVEKFSNFAQNEFVKESGLLKIVPIGILVGVLLFSIAVDRAVSFVGRSLPGQMGYIQPDLLVSSVPAEHLAKLWVLYPAAEDEYSLLNVLNQQITAIDVPAAKADQLPWISHDKIFFSSLQKLDVIKFYIFIGFCFLISVLFFRFPNYVTAQRVFVRFAVILVFCISIGAYYVISMIDAKKQSEWSKVNYLVATHVAAGEDSESRLTDAVALQAFSDRLREYRESEYRRDSFPFYIRW